MALPSKDMCYVMVEESASIKQPHTDCKYHLIIAAVFYIVESWLWNYQSDSVVSSYLLHLLPLGYRGESQGWPSRW